MGPDLPLANTGLDPYPDMVYYVDSYIHIHVEGIVKSVQMTIDEPLLEEVDRLIEELNTTRSAFVREALQAAIERQRIKEMERRHAEGYARHPVEPGEFDVWYDEQAWGAQ